MRFLALIFVLSTYSVLAQPLPATQQFRLVTPKGPGSITINTTGWTIERLALYDHGTRAVLQLQNDAIGIVASYILSNDETFDYNKESCKNDVLGPVVGDLLKKATLKNKDNTTRKLPSGQTLDIGSYLIVKSEGIELNQQNVFGFISQNHTCAEIHLSRTPFKPGEDQLFETTLNSFTFDPAYAPTAADYKSMAAILPPGMASEYGTTPQQTQSAATPLDSGQSLTFALPGHPGYLHMDAPNFVITELSAKPNGHEFGIRAKDSDLSGAEALGFLFLLDPPKPTAVACRDAMLGFEKSVKDRKIVKTYEDKSDAGVPLALLDYEQPKASPNARFVRRFFVSQGDLCADIAVTSANAISAQTAIPLLKTLVFDPNRTPDFFAKFRYAQVLYDHQQFAAAAPIFENALTLVSTVDDSAKWRRVTTDQASIAYGISGDLAKSRAINQAAILKDPTYPFYYYNLACADAESGDATSAQTHLQQAFDRRANTLPGEHLPDPTQDDSILKLKPNQPFWTFVQSLPMP